MTLNLTRIQPLDDDSISAAVTLWQQGHLVAFGTETVYGLGADAGNALAVTHIFKTKNRPEFNPLISHLPDQDSAFGLAMRTTLAEQLAEAFWPGPMTLVLNRQDHGQIADLVTAGLDSLALRVPGHAGARELLKAVGTPIAAPSANSSGRLSPTTADHVADSFHHHSEPRLIIDTGPCQKGLESTIIDARGEAPILLRPGSVTADMIKDVTGYLPLLPEHKNPPQLLSPGQLASHYAPRAQLRLNATTIREGEAWLGFGTDPILPPDTPAANLSPDGNLDEAASQFFSLLHQLDATGVKTIAVAAIPETGLGVAIHDRLCRAAAPRP
jgi:L-threonylcarbamoyladenylate synthase